MNPHSRIQNCRRLLALLLCFALAGCSWLRGALNRHTVEAQRLTREAQLAQESGDLERAAMLLSKAIEENPEDSEVRRRLGDVLLANGQKAEAVVQFREALAMSPDDAAGQARLARLLFELDQPDNAEDAVKAALAIEPKNTTALLLKSELADRKHNDSIAMETCHQVLANEPDNAEAQLRIAAILLRSSKPERAASLLRQVCQNSKATEEQVIQAKWSLGIAYGQQKRWDEAADAISVVLDRRPNATADEWYRLAYANYFAGDVDAAARDIARALKQQPDHIDSQALASALNVDTGQSPIAMAGYRSSSLPKPVGW